MLRNALTSRVIPRLLFIISGQILTTRRSTTSQAHFRHNRIDAFAEMVPAHGHAKMGATPHPQLIL